MQSTRTNLLTFLSIIIICMIAASVLISWYLKGISSPSSHPTRTSSTATTKPADLGSTLYNKISNPISGVLPSTLTPVPNPANSFYINPFK